MAMSGGGQHGSTMADINVTPLVVITRVPIGVSTPSPTFDTTPAISWPGVNGSGGVSGYMLRDIKTSGRPMPAAVTLICN